MKERMLIMKRNEGKKGNRKNEQKEMKGEKQEQGAVRKRMRTSMHRSLAS